MCRSLEPTCNDCADSGLWPVRAACDDEVDIGLHDHNLYSILSRCIDKYYSGLYKGERRPELDYEEQ